LCRKGMGPGAIDRNWASYGSEVVTGNLEEWQRRMLCDPQTSGGLLVSCSPGSVPQVLELFRSEGFFEAAVIGRLLEGDPVVKVA
ncbi:MAG: selenide, water dikinase SelD, partial [Burkholderiales bacterium]|nr:selenide, water dikinase SelD [Burkholderiales bacterium]